MTIFAMYAYRIASSSMPIGTRNQKRTVNAFGCSVGSLSFGSVAAMNIGAIALHTKMETSSTMRGGTSAMSSPYAIRHSMEPSHVAKVTRTTNTAERKICPNAVHALRFPNSCAPANAPSETRLPK